MITFLLIGLYLTIGAVAFIIEEKNDPCETRGEYITTFITCCILAPVTLIFVITKSKWWNEKL